MASRPAKRSRSNDDEPVSSMGETDVDHDVFSFVWTINNYSTLFELGAVESPVFAEVQRTTTAEETKILRMRMEKSESSKVSILHHRRRWTTFFQRGSEPYDKWGYDDFADLLNPSNLAVDDKVKILCKVWIYGSIGTDVTISGSNTNFKAHKLILSARSTVFAAMFNSGMLENRSNFVEIADFEDDVVKGMLEHLYTG
ncbi:Speckle-type POZ protein B [Orchesella cincta]|uniref:Speckle-type POZ protein B n=1 Tax=Orchesella cincta TaxID=48709 RepID=A0A1D2M715_ORCCI|nr:Speckle-type POZ protein B [Orchesella cincta]